MRREGIQANESVYWPLFARAFKAGKHSEANVIWKTIAHSRRFNTASAVRALLLCRTAECL